MDEQQKGVKVKYDNVMFWVVVMVAIKLAVVYFNGLLTHFSLNTVQDIWCITTLFDGVCEKLDKNGL